MTEKNGKKRQTKGMTRTRSISKTRKSEPESGAVSPLVLLTLRIVAALLSGMLLYASFEPMGHWKAGIFGTALLFVALAPWPGRFSSTPKIWTGILLAVIQSATFYGLLLPWIGSLVGSGPFLALVGIESLYAIVLGLFGVLVARWKVFGAVAFALLFVAVEFWRSSWPFGGFPWGRIAWGQINGPIAAAAPIGGPALVTFATVLVGAGIMQSILRPNPQAIAGSVVAFSLAAVAVVPGFPIVFDKSGIGSRTVAAIQGNVPRLGLEFNEQRKAVLKNHVRVTSLIGQPVDFVIWPENAADVSPFYDQEARDLVDGASKTVNAPILVGTLDKDEVGMRNTAVVWDYAHGGAGDQHVKKYLQPFGEYMPYRDLLRKVSSYVDLAGDFKPGDGPGVVHMTSHQDNRTTVVGVATCYEVAFDGALRDSVKNGAEILAIPTNNATFGFSDMTYQQLAMGRMRAMELHRDVVVAATSGVSAIVLADGKVVASSEIFKPADLVRQVTLYNQTTPAARWGTFTELILVIMGIVAALASVFAARRRRG